MISVQEAKSILSQYSQPLPPKSAKLLDACGRVLSEDIFSAINVPPFHQSSVDGYALKYNDLSNYESLTLALEIPAGIAIGTALKSGETARIFTGSPLPDGADTVIMQEYVEVHENIIICKDEFLTIGGNVRPMGSQTKRGECALPSGTLLSPAGIGLLAGLGVTDVSIIPSPRISLITTGNELIEPGNNLLHGQVFESNSYSLQAALGQMHIQLKAMASVRDNESQTTECIRTMLPDCDVLLLTGGVSVGDYDYVPKALANCGVQKIIHKIRQRPGKPFYFGMIGSTLVFGLPGNPSSVLTCFYRYVQPALYSLMKIYPTEPQTIRIPLAKPFVKKAGLTYFLKGQVQEGVAIPLGAQESYQMNTYATAECLIELEESRIEYESGEIVTVYIL